VKAGRRPSSFKESTRDPNTGRTGRYAGRNKAYPCGGDTDNISMDELRPDLVSHMSVTNISGRLDDNSPPSTSDHARTSLDQKNGFRASSNLSKSQSSGGKSPFDSIFTETGKKDQIQVNMSLMVTYEDVDVEQSQKSTAGIVGNTTEINRSY
jgi:hypothetical protein